MKPSTCINLRTQTHKNDMGKDIHKPNRMDILKTIFFVSNFFNIVSLLLGSSLRDEAFINFWRNTINSSSIFSSYCCFSKFCSAFIETRHQYTFVLFRFESLRPFFDYVYVHFWENCLPSPTSRIPMRSFLHTFSCIIRRYLSVGM